MPLFLSDWSPTTCGHTAPRSGILGSNAGMSAGDGRTIELRIRISRRGGASARCSGSRARGQPRNFFGSVGRVLDVTACEAAQDGFGLRGAEAQRSSVLHHLVVLLADQLPVDRPGQD